MQQYPLYEKLSHKLRAIKNGGYFRCGTCGAVAIPPNNLDSPIYCSRKCGNNSPAKIAATKIAAANPERNKKIEATNIAKYGAKLPFQSKAIQDKVKTAVKEKYGVSNVSCLDSIKERKLKNLLSKTHEEREQINANRLASKIFRLTGLKLSASTPNGIKQLYCKSQGIEIPEGANVNNLNIGGLHRMMPNNIIKMQLGLVEVSRQVINEYYTNPTSAYELYHKLGLVNAPGFRSYPEKEISDWLASMGIEHSANDRNVIKPKEIDIIIPSHKIGIEFNGVYWHDSLRMIDKQYHQDKCLAAREAGWQLVQVWEDDWVYKEPIIKSIIKAKLGLFDKKIHARKCSVVRLSSFDAIAFFEANHLKGLQQPPSCSYGLMLDGELVMAISLRTNRGEWELQRMASKLDTFVAGGFSKLLAAFDREYGQPIKSYADLDIANGRSYEACGFILQSITPPSYWYFDMETGQRVARQSMQKHKLESLLPDVYDTSLSEEEIVLASDKFYRHHNAGNLVYVRPAMA